MKPSVAVVIPCYNTAPVFLLEAVNSALAQDIPTEVIVVDDGSTAQTTVDCLNSLPASVKVLHTTNGGPAAARNHGIAATEALCILPLDADDRISPNFARLTLQELEADPNVLIAYSDFQMFDASKVLRITPSSVTIEDLLIRNRFQACALFRRCDWERIGGYDESLRVGFEDYEFWVHLMADGGIARKAVGALLYYRVGHDGRHATQRESIEAVRATRRAIVENNPKHKDFFLLESQVALHLLNSELTAVRRENRWFQKYFGFWWRLRQSMSQPILGVIRAMRKTIHPSSRRSRHDADGETGLRD